MNKIHTLLLTLSSTLTASAVAPYPGPVTYTQPDDSQIEVTIKGPETGHLYYRTGSTTPMLPDEAGFLRPATDSQLYEINKTETGRTTKGVGLHESHFPSTGEPRMCVILVQFNDIKFSVADPAGYFSRWLSQEGFSDHGAIGSVRDYFKAQSSGRYAPKFDVYGPVTLGSNRSTYASTKNAYKMVHEAAGAIDKNVDFTQYDIDGDGNIDNIFIIYAGQGANHGAANAPWPHNSECPTSIFTRKKVDGKLLYHYACCSELGRSTTAPDGIGTFVHEFGHIIGLSDLYNTESANEYTPNWWSVMDTGCYLGDSNTPCNYSAYERRALDWLEYVPLTEPADVNLRSMTDYNFACVIESGRSGDYFVLENRPATGWDRGFMGEGMLIWHIDASDTNALSNNPNNDSSHLRVDLIEADNSTGTGSYAEIAGDPWPGNSENTEYTATSTPAMLRWNASTGSGKTPVDKPVTNISRHNNGLVSFRFMGGNSNNRIDPATSYDISVKTVPVNGGTAYIDDDNTAQHAKIAENTDFTLHAVPEPGFRFKCWKHGSETISTNADVTLLCGASSSGTYTAEFESTEGATYCTPEGNSLYDRYITSIVLTNNLVNSPLKINLQETTRDAIYLDRTTSVYAVNAGATITAYFYGYSPNTHSYMYVDWGNDGFEYSGPSDYLDETDDYAIRPGSDLVYYSRWSPDNSNWYSSSTGKVNGSQADGTAQISFTIPTRTPAGTYRMRFKNHWCSLDPCGDANLSESTTLANIGGAVADFTLLIKEPLSGIDSPITDSADEMPAEYYDLRGVKLNGTPTMPGIYIMRRGTHTRKVALGIIEQ